jgi:hypothetical protein
MHRPLISVLALSLVAGCDSAADTDTGSESDPTVTLELTVGHFAFVDGIAGLDVCVMETDNCAMTDDIGLALLTVPADSDIGVTIEGEGYTPTLLPYSTTSDDLIADIFLAPLEVMELVFADMDLDLSKGHVSNTLYEGAGYTAEIDTGETIHYWNDYSTAIDGDATSTTASGRFSALNVTADTVTVTVEGPGTCTARDRYATSGPNEVVLPILPGFFSGLTMDCE